MASVYECTPCSCKSHGARESYRSPGTGVICGSEILYMCWKILEILGPLEDHTVLLTTEPSLNLLK